ncbi:hypothetical protein OAU50_04745 [Planctomycetota bacterium]|nr:hypothetical protein [Planctomycetota bacterium]
MDYNQRIKLDASDEEIATAIRRMADEARTGTVVLFKIDGERNASDDNGPFTVVLSGGSLGDEYVRKDSHDAIACITDCLEQVTAIKDGLSGN